MKSTVGIALIGSFCALVVPSHPVEAQGVLFLKGKKNAERQRVVPPVPPLAIAQSATRSPRPGPVPPAPLVYGTQRPGPPLPPLLLKRALD